MADQVRFEQLRDGKMEEWKKMTLAEVEASGQQETLNWACLARAMNEMNQKVEILDYKEYGGRKSKAGGLPQVGY